MDQVKLGFYEWKEKYADDYKRDENGKFAAAATGSTHTGSEHVRIGKKTAHFHTFSHENPGEAAHTFHDVATSEGGHGAEAVDTPKPHGSKGAWKVRTTQAGESHHYLFSHKI